MFIFDNTMKTWSVKINYNIFHRWIISLNTRTDESLSQHWTDGRGYSCRLSREPHSYGYGSVTYKSMGSVTSRIEIIKLPDF